MIRFVVFNFIKFWTIEIYMANKEFEIIPGYRTEVVEEIRKMGIASLPDLRKRLGINSKATIRKAVARNPKGIVIQYVFDSSRGWTTYYIKEDGQKTTDVRCKDSRNKVVYEIACKRCIYYSECYKP